jgi:hypothetical protein
VDDPREINHDEADASRPFHADWRGRPLRSREVIVETIAATTTRTGLTVDAALDTGSYPTGIKGLQEGDG